MPRRPPIHDAISPRTPSNAVNEVLGALSRKLTVNHVETAVVTPTTTERRNSLTNKMDQILHPVKKAKDLASSRDKDTAKEKKNPLMMRTGHKSKSATSSRRPSTSSPFLKPAPGRFEMIMESPPVVLHGSARYSSGALLSGRLKFNVEDPVGEVTLTKFDMVLRVNTTSKRPVHKDCKDCSIKHDVIKEWKFLSEPKSYLKMKDNQIPWAYLLDGSSPATTHCQLGSLVYEFLVTARTITGEEITFTHLLEVSRAVPTGPDKGSIRIFPPTNLTGRVAMPPVVHPIGTFPVTMSLSGVVEKKESSQTRWRLKKVMWRIEEHSKIKSAPCDRHKHKVTESKALQLTDAKQLGSGELKSGWKTDFDTTGGEITLEFEASLATRSSHKSSCDSDSQYGLEVKHNLIVELIVAEEFVPTKNTALITPTGAARVLRMQFSVVVTERSGMGISWDDEMPPMYEDVPPSPPGYGNADKNDGAFGGAVIEDYEGPDFDYADLERVHTNNPADPPLYRERQFPDLDAGLLTRDAIYSDDIGPSHASRHLGGFRLDELEAEPNLPVRRRASDEGAESTIDYGEGSAGAAS